MAAAAKEKGNAHFKVQSRLGFFTAVELSLQAALLFIRVQHLSWIMIRVIRVFPIYSSSEIIDRCR